MSEIPENRVSLWPRKCIDRQKPTSTCWVINLNVLMASSFATQLFTAQVLTGYELDGGYCYPFKGAWSIFTRTYCEILVFFRASFVLRVSHWCNIKCCKSWKSWAAGECVKCSVTFIYISNQGTISLNIDLVGCTTFIIAIISRMHLDQDILWYGVVYGTEYRGFLS